MRLVRSEITITFCISPASEGFQTLRVLTPPLGASIPAIATAIAADIQTTGVSLGIVAALVGAIRQILGC